MRKVIFISGKITGERIDRCYHKFLEARNDIHRKYGGNCGVMNPLKISEIHFGISHKEAMEVCFRNLIECTHIYMLKDWKESKGAVMEHEFAIENGIKIIYEI